MVALVHAAMLAPIVPLSDALATTAARRSESGEGGRFEYGWLRASGSTAFVVGTMLSGWTANDTGLASIVWVSGTLLAIGGAAALLLPKIPAAPTLSDNLARSTTRDWASLLQIPAFRLLLIIAALVEGSHALHDSFSVIRWRAAGVGLPVISALWSESVLSEVLVFLLIGPRLVRMLGPGGAITLAAVAGIIRWTVAAFTTSPILLAFVQPLHGFTFALLHLAAMQVIVRVDTTPFGCDSASHLRHIMHRAGHGLADPAFRPALWSDGRHRVSRHGCALFAGAAYVRSIAAILWKLTTMLSTNTMRG